MTQENKTIRILIIDNTLVAHVGISSLFANSGMGRVEDVLVCDPISAMQQLEDWKNQGHILSTAICGWI